MCQVITVLDRIYFNTDCWYKKDEDFEPLAEESELVDPSEDINDSNDLEGRVVKKTERKKSLQRRMLNSKRLHLLT